MAKSPQVFASAPAFECNVRDKYEESLQFTKEIHQRGFYEILLYILKSWLEGTSMNKLMLCESCLIK